MKENLHESAIEVGINHRGIKVVRAFRCTFPRQRAPKTVVVLVCSACSAYELTAL